MCRSRSGKGRLWNMEVRKMVNWIWIVVALFAGYIIGWMRNLWQIKVAFPDLYYEMKRRCEDA